MSIEGAPSFDPPLLGLSFEGERNPNSIGELLALSSGRIETREGRVYRSVLGLEAIKDILESGVVRNAFSAGKKGNSRWGDRVFWSAGVSGKRHVVSKGSYVIEAPKNVAEERQVRKEDVIAVWTIDENGDCVDIWKEIQANEERKERA